MKKPAFLALSLILFLLSCKKPVDNSHEFKSVEIQYLGNERAGYCGYLLFAAETPSSNYMYFKPINLPDSLKLSGSKKYTVKLELTPKYCDCKDGMVDPMPGKPEPVYHIPYVYILEAKKN